jgi:DNA helicase-2/ATP-dependent DNA helicase PcrA
MDKTFQEEQQHLTEVYRTILKLRDDLTEELETHQQEAAEDLQRMSDELHPDTFGVDADEIMETLAAIETLNSVIDAYNARRDYAQERMQRVLALLRQPYFAKVRIKFRPNRPARDVYIGAVGLTDDDLTPLVVDWRSPVAETYYKQENGLTTYKVDGRERKVELELRRQFDIQQDKLLMYFDTTVAIEDSLLLGALKRHHSEKLQAITATIQREQNEVVRHDDTPVLLVSGIAGSGKTSVLLQRIAYLFYQERDRLEPQQVSLFTPNAVFGKYIDSVLPSLGESNPMVYTWQTFMEKQGLGNRDVGADADPEVMRQLEEAVPDLDVDITDLRDIRLHDVVLLKAAQIKAAWDKYAQFPVGPRRMSFVLDELYSRLNRKLQSMAKSEELQEELLSLDVEDQEEIFGDLIGDADDEERVLEFARTYVEHRFGHARDLIDYCDWLRIDRLGARIANGHSLNATEWLWLWLLITGGSSKDTRYVMIDEVQDYSLSQLMLLSRFFPKAHFLLLGDEHQAIREGTATWDQIRQVFTASHGKVDECSLLTSYRSSPEITELFSTLLSEEERGTLSSVRRAGVAPHIVAFDNTDEYISELRSVATEAQEAEGLTAIIATEGRRVSWLAKQLGDTVQVLRKNDRLPARGVVLMDLALAKGLEFDHVVVADAQAEVYPDTPLARRRLYTAVSRAMHRVTVLAQGELTPLLSTYLNAQ